MAAGTSPGARAKLIALVGAAAAAGAIALVPQFEGRVHHVYADPIGVLTYCDGATKDPVKGKTYSDEECDNVLASNLYEEAQALTQCVHVPLNDGEKVAWLSFTINVGPTAFCSSTAVKKLNAGDHAGACAEMSRWTRAGGKEWPGLVKRRARERAICEGKQ